MGARACVCMNPLSAWISTECVDVYSTWRRWIQCDLLTQCVQLHSMYWSIFNVEVWIQCVQQQLKYGCKLNMCMWSYMWLWTSCKCFYVRVLVSPNNSMNNHIQRPPQWLSRRTHTCVSSQFSWRLLTPRSDPALFWSICLNKLICTREIPGTHESVKNIINPMAATLSHLLTYLCAAECEFVVGRDRCKSECGRVGGSGAGVGRVRGSFLKVEGLGFVLENWRVKNGRS